MYHFTDVSITKSIVTSLLSFNKTWSQSQVRSRWSRPDRAGGCMNNKDTFLDNPQFLLDVGSFQKEVVFQLSQVDDERVVLARCRE